MYSAVPLLNFCLAVFKFFILHGDSSESNGSSNSIILRAIWLEAGATLSAMRFDGFTCLTFDCYGTLIDWESGILGALRPMLQLHGIERSDEQILSLYSELESLEQQRCYRTYREILRGVVLGFGDRMGFRPSLEDIEALPTSLPHWQPFPDTVAALRRLKNKYKLGIISNIDDDLFAHTARLLQVDFDWVITAQQAKSYKPSLANFQLALARIGLPEPQILHVAQSLYHDVVPAKALGMKTVWVNRQAGKTGATKPIEVTPDLVVPDLKTLADLVQRLGIRD